MRNPVIDVSLMWGVSDIPDWCYVEAGLNYDPATVPTATELSTLRSKSPIQYIDNVSRVSLAKPPSMM